MTTTLIVVEENLAGALINSEYDRNIKTVRWYSLDNGLYTPLDERRIWYNKDLLAKSRKIKEKMVKYCEENFLKFCP